MTLTVWTRLKIEKPEAQELHESDLNNSYYTQFMCTVYLPLPETYSYRLINICMTPIFSLLTFAELIQICLKILDVDVRSYGDLFYVKILMNSH